MAKRSKFKKFLRKSKNIASTGFARGGQAIRRAGKNIYRSYMTEEGQRKRLESQIEFTNRQAKLAEAQTRLAKARARQNKVYGNQPNVFDTGGFGVNVGNPFEIMGVTDGPTKRKKKNNDFNKMFY